MSKAPVLLSLHLRPLPALLLAFCTFAIPSPNRVNAAETEEARLTQVIKDVRLLPRDVSTRPASLNDTVHEGTAVRTGAQSRAELTFTNRAVARLGANTVFSLGTKDRNFDLASGAILMQMPKSSGRARIRAAAVSASIKGTTFLLEYYPNAYLKFILLEGNARLCSTKRLGECLPLHAGQMLIVNPEAKNLPDPVDVDLERLLKTCRLVTDFPLLPNQASVAKAASDQGRQKSRGTFIDTNLVIFGRGTLVSLVDPTAPNAGSQKLTASPKTTLTPRSSPKPESLPSQGQTQPSN